VKIKVKVVPSSKKVNIVNIDQNFLKINLVSSPQKNKANRELIEILSKHFNVKKTSVRILKGFSSPIKLIEIDEK